MAVSFVPSKKLEWSLAGVPGRGSSAGRGRAGRDLPGTGELVNLRLRNMGVRRGTRNRKNRWLGEGRGWVWVGSCQGAARIQSLIREDTAGMGYLRHVRGQVMDSKRERACIPMPPRPQQLPGREYGTG